MHVCSFDAGTVLNCDTDLLQSIIHTVNFVDIAYCIKSFEFTSRPFDSLIYVV